MSTGARVTLVVVLLAVAGIAGWYYYTKYASPTAGGTSG